MALPLLIFGEWTPWIVSGAVGAALSALVALWITRREVERLRAEHDELTAALLRDEAVLRGALDGLGEGVVVVDASGRFVVFNDAASSLLGRDPGPLPDGWPEAYTVYAADRRTRVSLRDLLVDQALRGQEPEALDVFLERAPGVGGHARATVRPIRDGSGRLLGAALLLLDRTELRRAEIEREALIEDLQRRNKELERFTYTVSHELRSPLVTIKGFLGLLRKDAEQGDAERLALDMERIGEAVDTMSALLEDLLELSRSGVVVNAAGTVDLYDLVTEVVRNLEGPIAEVGADVVVAQGMPTIRGDRRRLFEVFQNLVENALKFMGDQPEPRIEIGAREQAAGTVCFVRDNGIGIADEDRDRVFRIFERLDTSVHGTGVGLALVKGIVEAHRGTVWVESDGPGNGSTFYFSIPRMSDDA